MNRLLGGLAMALAVASMTACAPPPLTKAEVDGLAVCNPDHMDQVERVARRNNTAVYWVHCPRATLRVI